MKQFLICITVLLAFLIILLPGCQNNSVGEREISWDLYGAIIRADGKIARTVNFSIDGTYFQNADAADQVQMQIALPDRYPFAQVEATTRYTDEVGNLPFFCTLYQTFKPGSEELVYSAFALDMKNQTVIFDWGEQYGYWLVGSTDPQADLASLLEDYAPFVQQYGEQTGPGKLPPPDVYADAPLMQYSWPVYGALVNEAGEVLETAELTLNGMVAYSEDGTDFYDVKFNWPEGYYFQMLGIIPETAPYQTASTGMGGRIGEKDGPILNCSGAFDVDRKCIIVDWDDGNNIFLVASADPNADISALWEHFQSFIQRVPKTWPQVTG